MARPEALPADTRQDPDFFDAIVIGAGISGMYQLYRLRELGLRVRVYEAGSDVGGTWYWNRYPGARFDSESWSYGYSFSPELLQEWSWSENYASQPETLRYLNFVADKFDLRRDIQFDTRVESAEYIADSNLWEVTLNDGSRVSARFLITAIGVLSEPYVPSIEGAESFEGRSWHTAQWPHEPVDFSGQRVAVIGTGATAVQLITEVSKNVGQLYVFQRTPNYCVPLRNTPIGEEAQKKIKSSYPEIFDKCSKTFGGFVHGFDERSAMDVSAEEREAFYESLWNKPGFALWLGNFHDIFTNREANETLSEFVREKIRAQIDDPQVAEKLVPKDHGFGTKRVPLESGYYEAFNRDNVTLIDLNEAPIECITPTGIQTQSGHYAVDVIIFATGFDAVTGAFNRIEIRGPEGTLKEKWSEGPRTYLGLQSTGFPNLFTLIGPHNGGTFCNIPRCIEQNVEWVTDCIRYMQDRGFERISPERKAEDSWTDHVNDVVADTLIPGTDSWFMGANVPGKKRTFLMYAGGSPVYRKKCEDVAEKGYEGFRLE